MCEVAVELEAIYEALSCPSATYEQRKVAFDAFERLKIQDNSFYGAREAVQRRKSEGSVYTALLIIEHNISHFWERITVKNNMDEVIMDIVKQSAEMSSNLISGGASNVGFSACLKKPGLLLLLLNEIHRFNLVGTEIFFLILEKTLTAVSDYCKNIRTIIRNDLREMIGRSLTRIYKVAYDKVNIALTQCESCSFRVISTIFSSLCSLTTSEFFSSQGLVNSDNIANYITVSFTILDVISQKYKESVVLFLRILSEKILASPGHSKQKKVIVSEDILLTFSNFIKSSPSHSSRHEGVQLFYNLVRIIGDIWEGSSDFFSKYIIDILNTISVFNEPSINLITVRILHMYTMCVAKISKQLYYQLYPTLIEIYFKICVNNKKCEYTVNFNSTGDDNRLFKECEMVIYRCAMTLFSEQDKALETSIKYGFRLIQDYLCKDSMNVVEYSGIVLGLNNISIVLNVKSLFISGNQYSAENQNGEVMDEAKLLLNQLLNVQIQSLKHFNCFVDLSQCSLQYLSIVPSLWTDFIKIVHSHTLGFIKATKDYTLLTVDSIYWLRRSNKSLVHLLKAIVAIMKKEKLLSNLVPSFTALITDTAFNLCIFDWIERDYLEIYISMKYYFEELDPLSPTLFNFYIGIFKTYNDNQVFINGLNSSENFINVFGLCDDFIKPHNVNSLQQLFQFISITSIYYSTLKPRDLRDIYGSNADEISAGTIEVIKMVLRIWKCYFGIFDSSINCFRSPQLIKTIINFNRRVAECSYEQRYTSFENLEQRLYYFGKNIIRCLSSIFIFTAQFFSETTASFLDSFYMEVWKPFSSSSTFVLLPLMLNSILNTYLDYVKDPRSHSMFVKCFIEIINDMADMVTTRSLTVKSELNRIENSVCTEEGNDSVDAYNITEDVLSCISQFCHRIIDISALVNIEIVRYINHDGGAKQTLEPPIASRFDCVVYCNHDAWIAIMMLLLTITAFGNSKTVTRICGHCFMDNHFKFRISHIENNPKLYSNLISRTIEALYIAFKNKDNSYQALLVVVNMMIYMIVTFKNVYPGFDVLIQQITSYPSLRSIQQTIEVLCQNNVTLKEKRQSLIKILNGKTDDVENVNILIEELEHLSVKEPQKTEKVDKDELAHWDVASIRFLFE